MSSMMARGLGMDTRSVRERWPIGTFWKRSDFLVWEVVDYTVTGIRLKRTDGEGEVTWFHYRVMASDFEQTELPPAPSTVEFVPPPPRQELRWVGVDLDETLARGMWTPENNSSEIGAPIERNVHKVRQLAAKGWKIQIHTSRPWHEYETIKAWARFHGIPVDGVQCGKPLYAAYIDDRAIFAGDADWTPKTSEVRRAEPS